MIVDGHAHASGDYGTAGSIAATLDAAGVHQVVLCPGDSTGTGDYWLPDLASRYPQRDLLHAVNGVVRVAVALTGKARNIAAGNETVFRLLQTSAQRIRQCYWFDPRYTSEERTPQTSSSFCALVWFAISFASYRPGFFAAAVPV